MYTKNINSGCILKNIHSGCILKKHSFRVYTKKDSFRVYTKKHSFRVYTKKHSFWVYTKKDSFRVCTKKHSFRVYTKNIHSGCILCCRSAKCHLPVDYYSNTRSQNMGLMLHYHCISSISVSQIILYLTKPSK